MPLLVVNREGYAPHAANEIAIKRAIPYGNVLG